MLTTRRRHPGPHKQAEGARAAEVHPGPTMAAARARRQSDSVLQRALVGDGLWHGISGELIVEVAEALELGTDYGTAARVALVVVKMQARVRAKRGRRAYGEILQKHYIAVEAAEAEEERRRLEDSMAFLERVQTEKDLMDASLLQGALRHSSSLTATSKPYFEKQSLGAGRPKSFREAMSPSRSPGSMAPPRAAAAAAELDLTGLATPVEEDGDE